MQAAWFVNLPGTGQTVRISQSNVQTLMIGEVEIVAAQRIFHPIRNPDQGWALNILADAGVEIGPDNGPV